MKEQDLIRIAHVLYDKLLANPSFQYNAEDGKSFTELLLESAQELDYIRLD